MIVQTGVTSPGELGFSLKPPKWARKASVKSVTKFVTTNVKPVVKIAKRVLPKVLPVASKLLPFALPAAAISAAAIALARKRQSGTVQPILTAPAIATDAAPISLSPDPALVPTTIATPAPVASPIVVAPAAIDSGIAPASAVPTFQPISVTAPANPLASPAGTQEDEGAGANLLVPLALGALGLLLLSRRKA